MNFFKNKLIKRFRFLNLLTLFGLFVCQTVYSQTSGDNIQYSSMYLQPFNRHAVKVPFSTSDPGTPTPIHWGMDTAWDDEGNVLRGINFIGLDRLTYGRISFQVMDPVKEDGSLSDRQINYLKSRTGCNGFLCRKGNCRKTQYNDGRLGRHGQFRTADGIRQRAEGTVFPQHDTGIRRVCREPGG